MSHSLPWTAFHHRLHQTIRRRQLLKPNQRLLIAVSGGQDSLCLAQLLVDLQPKWSWELAIAHCDHRWQADSKEAVQQVQRQANEWGLPFFLQTAPDSVAQDQREATARSWRYQAWAALAEAQGYSHVLTGHTASDRAETLLHNLLRGSGLDGLQALSWRRSLSSNVELVRPLLKMTRAETGEFCRHVPLHVWHDPSNQDLHYTRNRIRHDLLPILCDRFNPNVESVLAQTAELMRADVEYLEAEAAKIWTAAVQLSTDASMADLSIPKTSTPETSTTEQNYHFDQHHHAQELRSLGKPLRLDRYRLRGAPLALQRRVIRRCLLTLLPEAPGYDHIEKVVGLINAPNKSQTDPFPGGAIARVDGQWLTFFDP